MLMDIVIRIPKGKEERLIRQMKLDRNFKECEIVELPKRHGRLIDADAFIARMEDASERQKYKKLLIDDCLTVDDVFKAIIESLQNKGLANGDTPTIIEADTESEDRHDKR